MLHEQIDRHVLRRIAPRGELVDAVLGRLITHEQLGRQIPLIDEEVWTLLFTYGYALGEEDGMVQLASALTGGSSPSRPFRAWLEMLSYPPRKGVRDRSERNSHIDLTLGHLVPRPNKKAGLQYQPPDKGLGWLCMIEAKWLSDVATQTKHDCQRNQLARLIETALTFQQFGREPVSPTEVHVTLLTPQRFKTPNSNGGGSRLYFYKFREYCRDGVPVREAIIADIDLASVPRRPDMAVWRYPDLPRAIDRLQLHWVTFEELLPSMPDTRFKSALTAFLRTEPRPMLVLPGE